MTGSVGFFMQDFNHRRTEAEPLVELVCPNELLAWPIQSETCLAFYSDVEKYCLLSKCFD